MSDIQQFILARIKDDEQQLRRLARRSDTGLPPEGVLSLERRIADCAARRELVRSLEDLQQLPDLPLPKPVHDAASVMLKAMARPYRDHDTYRSEWSERANLTEA